MKKQINTLTVSFLLDHQEKSIFAEDSFTLLDKIHEWLEENVLLGEEEDSWTMAEKILEKIESGEGEKLLTKAAETVIRQFLKKAGKKGGETTARKHPEHLQRWAKRAAEIRWRRHKLGQK